MQKVKAGIIGGSALYSINGAKVLEQVDIDTPWGKPSDSISIVEIDGHVAAFLPRHARGHVYLPHEINYRANIAAFKMLGVSEIIAFSAVGSLKEDIRPRDFVIPDQVIDRTKSRPSTFFGDGIAAHVGFADPFCPRLRGMVEKTAAEMNLRYHTGETLVCMEGPAFSSRAESYLYRSWGAGVINMSTLPEAKLAREAELCYAVVCMSTDYDCWHEEEEDVTIDMVIQNLNACADKARALIVNLLHAMNGNRDCRCGEASKYAVITAKDRWPEKQKKNLETILPGYFRD
jgi:5'-methylthioadenosine phosphorylase